MYIFLILKSLSLTKNMCFIGTTQTGSQLGFSKFWPSLFSFIQIYLRVWLKPWTNLQYWPLNHRLRKTNVLLPRIYSKMAEGKQLPPNFRSFLKKRRPSPWRDRGSMMKNSRTGTIRWLITHELWFGPSLSL